MQSFQQDLTSSAEAFMRVVWPAIKGRLGGGEIVPVESVADKGMATMLDQRSGIDAWHLSTDKQVRGIASRVQWGTPWDTFTVRYSRDSGAKTEYEKRKNDINSSSGWLYPHLTVQAFIAGKKSECGPLLSVGIIKTRSLIDACDQIVAGNVQKNFGGIRPTGNATFIWAKWSWLKNAGYDIKTISFQQMPEAA